MIGQNPTNQVNYLLKLTDSIGLIEHCCLDKPNYIEGYCVDDNARAIQVCLRYQSQFPVLKNAFPLYYHFIKSAYKNKLLYNDLNLDNSWQQIFERDGEHLGRSLAALGEIIKFEPSLSLDATNLFNQLYRLINPKTSHHLRTFAQIILGLQYYQSENIKIWADLLVSHYKKNKINSWNWFEPQLSHDNGRLPLALLIAYQITHKSSYLKIALESLDFLTKQTFNKETNCFVFPGNKKFFGQQPIEAGSMVETYSLAFHLTRDRKYFQLSENAFNWYYGQNVLGLSLVNSKTGGIYDGLEKDGVNLNQGAESVLSYLLAFNSLKNLR
ncbi:MAG: hypothetical protein WC503_05435 [Candidatus Shapirobacteria bacterium]